MEGGKCFPFGPGKGFDTQQAATAEITSIESDHLQLARSLFCESGNLAFLNYMSLIGVAGRERDVQHEVVLPEELLATRWSEC